MMIPIKSIAIDSLKKDGISMNIVVFQIKRMNRFYKIILLNILIEGNSIFGERQPILIKAALSQSFTFTL